MTSTAEPEYEYDYKTLKRVGSLGMGMSMSEFVTEQCKDKEVLNFYYYRSCMLPEGVFREVLFYMSCVLIIAISFYLLGAIAPAYLTPILMKIFVALNWSETLSSVTC